MWLWCSSTNTERQPKIMRTCTRHGRYDCSASDHCIREIRNGGSTADNAGDISIGANTGDLNIGIGGGLVIDTATGDLGIEIAPGISIDF